MIVEVRPCKDDPKAVEFFAAGKRIENIKAEKIFNDRGKLSVRAVIEYKPADFINKSKASEKGDTDAVSGKE